MALSRDIQRRTFPLAVYNFRVKVDEISMSFTEISGLAVKHDQVSYRHGLSFLEGEIMATVPFGRFSEMTCKRGTILGSDPHFFQRWMMLRDSRSMDVSLCDETGAPAVSWRIQQAVPVTLQAPTFNASSNEAAIDTVTLMVRGIWVTTVDDVVGTLLHPVGG